MTIFDLETRIDLYEEYISLVEQLDRTVVDVGYGNKKLLYLLDSSITKWPYRDAATSMMSFLTRKGVLIWKNYSDLVKTDVEILRSRVTDTAFSFDANILFFMELVFNLLLWIPKCYESTYIPLQSIISQYDYIVDNLKYVIERCDYKIRIFHEGKDSLPKYVLTRKDAIVDSVLHIAPDIKDALLSYNDLRNEKDVEYKKVVLKHIADYLEDKRSNFRGTCYQGLSESVFYAFNNLGIRHSNEKQYIFKSKEEQIELYDKVFYLALHLIQSSTIDLYKKDIDIIKKIE